MQILLQKFKQTRVKGDYKQKRKKASEEQRKDRKFGIEENFSQS
jgi:hypothetical protein